MLYEDDGDSLDYTLKGAFAVTKSTIAASSVGMTFVIGSAIATGGYTGLPETRTHVLQVGLFGFLFGL